MRKIVLMAMMSLFLWGFCLAYGLAGETGHYVNGAEGIKAATLPPSGFYYRMYNVFYNADSLRDENGDELDVDFDVSIYALVNRFIWISDKKILGGNFFMDAVIPLINTEIEIGAAGVSDNKFGLGDINLEPFGISWHGLRSDAAIGLSVYVPTGEYEKNNAASPGKDFWTVMFTMGGTVYFDAEKTWAASILGRYETHSEKSETNVQPGEDFHFEWGVSKAFAKFWDVGLTGYFHWQVTDDSGSDAVNTNVHDQVYAIGPEVSAFCPFTNIVFSLRSQWEFQAEDRSEGNVTTLTLTKIF